MERYSLRYNAPIHECWDCPACVTKATKPPRSWCCEESLSEPREVDTVNIAPLWCPVADTLSPSPAGEWFHERDPGWGELWLYHDYEDAFWGRMTAWVRADVLLSLDRAFRAWRGIE